MARSLQRVFNLMDRTIGMPVKTGGNSKLIISPYNSRERRIVPSYEQDFIWQNARKEVHEDLGKLTSPTSNMERNNFVIETMDRTAMAIPENVPFRKRVVEI